MVPLYLIPRTVVNPLVVCIDHKGGAKGTKGSL